MGKMVSMRQARIEDAPLVAWDLETATDRMFSFMLGSPWEQFLIRVVNTPGHAWSIAHARIAEIEGKPLGVILSGQVLFPNLMNRSDYLGTGRGCGSRWWELSSNLSLPS